MLVRLISMACMFMAKDFNLTNTARPLGPELPGWTPATLPHELQLQGTWAALRPVDVARDAKALWTAFEGHDWVWDYLSSFAPQDLGAFSAILQANADRAAQPCYVISDLSKAAPLGYACYWTVSAEMGYAEIGNVNLSPDVQRSPVATEAFFLMIDWAFSHGYRRMEWKCDALNAPSRRAAARLGFSYEGIFRNHYVIKGRSRDTAWFAMTNDDWQGLRPAFVAWLSDANFDSAGRQKSALRALTAPHLVARDPVWA